MIGRDRSSDGDRRRRDLGDPTGQDFEDPLSNYDPREYRDPLERALAERTVAAITHQPSVCIGPEQPVREAIDALAGLEVACLMIVEENRLLGIFSEWDVLQKVASRHGDLADRPVRDVMTENPVFVYETDSVASTLAVIARCGYRHVPVLDLQERVVGIVSPQRISCFLQEEIANA